MSQTESSIAARRRIARAMLDKATSTAPIQSPWQGVANMVNAGFAGWEEGRLDREEREGKAANAADEIKMGLPGTSPVSSVAQAMAGPKPAAPSFAGGGSGRTMSVPPEIKNGIVQTASALGIDPVDLATTISYETGGTFDPTKRGPTTKWGQHRGLIQFGEPQAKQHGVDWSNPVGSQLGPNGAVASYLRTAGVKPGMGLLDIYSAVNAGAPGLYDRSDTAAGGAPGTVRDKVENQMQGHRQNAMALLRQAMADMPAPGAMPAAAETGASGFAVPGQPAPMSGRTFDQITSGAPLDPVFQSEGVSQPWMGTALKPSPAVSQVAAALTGRLPPPRPADLPAPGAVEAVGRMPQPATPMMPDLSNESGAGARELQVMSEQARQGQSPAAGNPISAIAAALTGQSAPAPAAAPQTAAAAPQGMPAATAGPAPAAAAAPAPAAAPSATDRTASAMRVLSSPYATEGQRMVAKAIVEQSLKDPAEAEGRRLDLEIKRKTLAKDDKPSEVREYEYAKGQGYAGTFTDYQRDMRKAGGTSVNVGGGGSDKQVFDAVAENAKEARAAASGLVALREARGALAGGAITGAGADARLGLQKIGAAFGLGDVSKIENTETFRSAIAPQVAAMLKATVGSAQISNSDREFAEKAAGGSIQLDERSINRLLDIMEKGNIARIEAHQKQLETIYPDAEASRRERALFSVAMPPAPAPNPSTPVRVTTPEEARKLPSGTRIILPDGSEGRVP